MKILLLCDDCWHPGQIPADGVKPLEDRGFTFDAGSFDSDILREYPVVLLCKGEGWMTDAEQKDLVEYVENGGGLLAVHNGTVTTETNAVLSRLLGSRFLYHPHDCPVTVQPIKPHPVTDGVEMFIEVDEHYRLDIVADDIDIFAASYSPPQGDVDKYAEDAYHNSPAWICPAGYVRTQGKGRVCVLTPGHHLAVWHNPQFQRMLENALNWCAGR